MASSDMPSSTATCSTVSRAGRRRAFSNSDRAAGVIKFDSPERILKGIIGRVHEKVGLMGQRREESAGASGIPDERSGRFAKPLLGRNALQREPKCEPKPEESGYQTNVDVNQNANQTLAGAGLRRVTLRSSSRMKSLFSLRKQAVFVRFQPSPPTFKLPKGNWLQKPEGASTGESASEIKAGALHLKSGSTRQPLKMARFAACLV